MGQQVSDMHAALRPCATWSHLVCDWVRCSMRLAMCGLLLTCGPALNSGPLAGVHCLPWQLHISRPCMR